MFFAVYLLMSIPLSTAAVGSREAQNGGNKIRFPDTGNVPHIQSAAAAAVWNDSSSSFTFDTLPLLSVESRISADVDMDPCKAGKTL